MSFRNMKEVLRDTSKEKQAEYQQEKSKCVDSIIDYYTKLFKNRDPEKLILSTYGIGLHLVLELLIILNGNISFSNPDNKGTMVTIDIDLN